MALSKRSKLQCKKAALTGKRVCIFHGANLEVQSRRWWQERCAIAKTMHGWETRAARKYRAEKFRELKALFKGM
jgi:hypothetical protein